MENQTQTPGSMKQSVSMTSLPPPGPQEVSDMAVAKMRLERPYNSLKKKRNSERDIWRNSWGSGHSHASSCSIHSTATNGGGSGIGKDDFWAALQPNYNYIMDTNLLDSCREARCEFEGASAAAACVQESCCVKSIGPSTRTQNLVGDPRRLRRWLREMENEMTKAPSISTASKMKSAELKRRLNEHSAMENNNGPNSLLVEINCIENTKSDDVQSTSTKQSADYTDDSVLENFKISLANLKVNDKKLIESLTKVAGIGYQKASEIVHIIVNSESAEGLLKLYLIDSIIKGVGGPYIGFFSNELVKAFAKVFRIADYECRKKLFMLRNTWNGVVSQSTLTSLDITINEMDGNWPVNLNENPILIQTSIAMFIKSFLFEKLQTNEKIVEARIATDKYSIIKVGDTIKFICGSRITMRRVIGKAKYDSFQELLKKEGVNNCLPGATDLAEAVNYYRCFSNYKTLELIHGVLAFRLEPKDNDSGSNENGTFKFEGEGKRKPPDVNASAFDGSQGVIKKTQKERIGNIHDTPQELVLNVPKQVPKRVPKPICSIYDYNSEDDFEKDYTSQELFANAIVPESVGKCKPSDSKSGRPKDDVWSFVKTINGNIVCIYCEKKISPKAVRIRKHLSKCRPPTSTKNIVVIENIQIKAPGEKSILELDGPGDEKAVPITAIRTPITQKSKIPPTKPSRLQSKTQVEQLDGSRNDYRLDEIKSQEDIQVGKNPPVTKDVVIIQAPGEKSILELDGPGDEKAVPITAIRTPITQKSKIPPTKPSRLQSKTQVEQLDGSRNDYRLDEIKSQEDIQVGKNPPVTKDVVIIQAPGEKSILELDGPGDEKAVPITAIRTPITQKSKIPPTKPSRLQSKTQVEQLDSSRNDYRLDEIKSQEDIQVEKNPPVTKDVVIIQDEESILLCYLCGSPMPKLKCDECDESFCIKCFSIYHHHPLRKSHLSKEIVEPKLLKEDPREWINTTEKLSIPKELWSKIYDIKEGKIVTRAFTFYKNEIGDLLEKIVKCVILVRDQYTGKVMTIYTRCKHENCRRYNLICTNFNCESPIFAIHRTTNSVQHSEYLTKQLRGSTRVSNAEELKRTMPATHFRNMVDKAPEYLLAEKNASTIKSQEVFKKCRSQGLKKQDLSPDDFKDLVMLQEETKDEKYISKVISPYGVYMHDSKQFKLLHQLISQNKKVKIETIGRSDATGNVVTVAVVDGKPILYYTLMIQLKSDENNKHFTPFPVSEMLSVTHDASAIADWLFSFKACYLKEYPADFPILDRLITDFSYANIHAILHAFNATNIHLYLNEAYAYATQQKTFNATLLFWVKIHLCCTHLSNTFAENVHTHFNKKNNQRATNEQKVISEVLAAMMSMRNYNQLKETWHNLCILMKSKSENETTTQALQNLQRLCTEEFDPTKTFNYDYLMYGGDDISLEHFEADGSILDKPIYKSSKFYKDFSIIFNEVKTGTDLKIKKPTNPYYNESFLQSFMKRFVAILPLWTGLLLTDKSKFIRLNNQPIESYNKIVKDLLAEKCLEIGFRVRCTRFIKLMRGMINSNFKLIFWQVPTRRLNHGKQKSSQINSSSQILKNLSKLNSSSPVLQPETSSQTKITPNLQVPRKANKTSTSTSIHGVIQGLYREIVSQGRLVAACIRSSDTSATNDTKKSLEKSLPSETRKSDGNLKALERRYHLLYLKAIEVQCVFETLLARKESSASSVPLTPSDTDEEPLAKLPKLSDTPREPKTCSDSEEYLDAKGSDDEWFHSNHLAKNLIDASQNAGFDADSEGSDSEAIPKLSKSNNLQQSPQSPKPIAQHSANQSDNIQSIDMDTTISATPADCNGNANFKDSLTSINDASGQCVTTTPPKSGATKRTRQPDASKFNRSNRKSKNCAIFYFKHLDTDGENKDWSSQASEASEAFKSTASSEDEWIFNRNDKDEDDYLNESGDILDTSINTLVPVNDYNLNSTDVVDSPLSYKMDIGEKNGNISCRRDDEKKLNGNVATSTVATNGKGYAPFAMQYTKESIKQLVIEAETLVREEILSKTPSRNHRQSFAESSVHKNGCDSKATMSYPKIKRVQEWLHHQPSIPPTPLSLSQVGTDCEASGEYTTESDSVARDSDSSDGPSDSIATCLQDGGSNSQCTSTEVIGHSSSADPLTTTMDNESNEIMGSMQQVTMRSKRRNSDRPWSVSCLSQLNDTGKVIRSNDEITNQGLANHSISESALNTLSSPTTPSTVSHSTSGTMKTSESKSSLKKRRMRARKRLAGRKSESGSNGSSDCGATELSRILSSTLVKSESFSGQSTLMKDLSKALSLLSIPRKLLQNASSTSEMESEDDVALPKPKFQLGAYTSVYGSDIALKLGSSLAALANYNREGEAKDLSFTGTDNSNFSEQAWDNYQEKYLSEAYSEGFDSDAARRLMEFGDDYRNFLDSQSDCCSSLSAANNFDSLSPPRNRKPRGVLEGNSPSNSPSGDDLTLRRRRTAELESERRRKGSDGSRKIQSEESRKSGDHTQPLRRLSSKSAHNNTSRKLEHDFIAGLDKRKHEDSLLRRRLRSNDKSFSSSSSSGSEPEDETELKTLLAQSKSRLENTDALRIRHHLLRPEDYAEIIATCRDNVHCLQAVLRGSPGDVLSNIRGQEIRELLSSWESLLHWSENASVARQLQEEMLVLKSVLNKLGNRDGILDSESSIQMSIDELKNEKAQLHTHRSTMLRLNASVHSWLTRQEMKMEKSKTEITTVLSSTINDNSDQKTSVTTYSCSITNEPVSKDTAAQFDINFVDEELHKQLKNEVGDMYSAWDEADQRISSRLESLTTSLIAWKQFESGMTEFKEALGKDKGTLKGLTGALEMCGDDNEHSLAHDVKEVAKRLSERSESNIQQIAEQTKNIHLSTATTATAFNLKSTSNGSLSDSGMSDGGGSSDYSISERERHLNVLRRLARQLESALAPGSAAIISISQRMEAAEADLRSLQDTCRALIVQTAASQNQNQYGSRGQMQDAHTEMCSSNMSNEVPSLPVQQSVQLLKVKQPKRFVQSKRKPRRRSNGSSATPSPSTYKPSPLAMSTTTRIPSPEPDPDDPSDELEDDEKDPKKWAWRLAKYAVPVQVALVALICAICCLEPHCCDAVNNFSMSFTPQLRYVRGPPPI